ncbi:MAG: DUF871 domain-containing protein [Lactococcus sp.]|nr:DUF871 domain-containing protein [Lactococcus sp.]
MLLLDAIQPWSSFKLVEKSQDL